jgi:hypothetical protein
MPNRRPIGVYYLRQKTATKSKPKPEGVKTDRFLFDSAKQLLTLHVVVLEKHYSMERFLHSRFKGETQGCWLLGLMRLDADA